MILNLHLSDIEAELLRIILSVNVSSLTELFEDGVDPLPVETKKAIALCERVSGMIEIKQVFSDIDEIYNETRTSDQSICANGLIDPSTKS